jgi:GT2 family glycosyltransferase
MTFSTQSADYSKTNVPLVSVVVTGRNVVATIDYCIISLFEQTYPNFEIIYVDGKSSDGTYKKSIELKNYVERFEKCKRFMTLSIDNADSPAKGRNFGARVANGSLIAFIDADCVAQENWLMNLIKWIPRNDGIAGGPNIPEHFRKNSVTDAIDSVLATYLGCGGSPQFLKIRKLTEVYAVPACNLGISKSLFEEVGGFDEALRYNEDSDLCNRIRARGNKIIYNPEARVSHYIGTDSYRDFTRLINKYGLERGKNILYNSDLITHFNIFSIASFVILLSFLAVSFFIGGVLTISIILVGIFLSIVVVASIKSGTKNESRPVMSCLYRLGIYVTIYVVYNLGFMAGCACSLLRIKRDNSLQSISLARRNLSHGRDDGHQRQITE